MVAALADAPAVYRPSRYWQGVVARHAEVLHRDGLATFKQTLNTSYFGLGSRYFVRALPRLLYGLLRRPSLAPLRVQVRRCEPWDRRTDRLLAIAVALLFWRIHLEDPHRTLDWLREPSLGCPTLFRVGRHEVTQDLCHSVSELSFLRPHLPPAPAIAELGAGYGRLAYVILRALDGVRYHIVDIPPALYVSQSYLTAVLPELPVFRFRAFRSYDEVRDEMSKARLVFLEPQQLELLPADQFDAFITISSLDEMTWEQIRTYLSAIDRVCRGVFYTKQWERAKNPHDDFEVSEDSYPIPARWRTLRRRNALVPPRMFERIYACRGA